MFLKTIGLNLSICTFPTELRKQLERKEAVALLKELGIEHLIPPSSVLIQQRTPDNYQLRLEGDTTINLLRYS